MKNAVFSLIAIVLFSINGNAQESTQTEKTTFKEAELKTSSNGEEVVYKFNSEKDFEEGSDKIITELVNSKSGGSSNTDQPCMVTISMTVTVTIEASAGVVGGSTTVTVSGSITTTCENAVAAGIKLRKQLIAMARG
jgi:hypothetical protein